MWGGHGRASSPYGTSPVNGNRMKQLLRGIGPWSRSMVSVPSWRRGFPFLKWSIVQLHICPYVDVAPTITNSP